MERIVYIRGKFKGNNKEMKEAYFYAKEIFSFTAQNWFYTQNIF